jgi:ribonucleoside-diphosphate reductase alpha chain
MSKKETSPKGLQFQRHYTTDTQSVFEQFNYDYRTSVIRNPNGEIVFELKNVEVPAHWSQIATDILAQKYFRKAGVPQEDGSLGRETSDKASGASYGALLEAFGEKSTITFKVGARCTSFL